VAVVDAFGNRTDQSVLVTMSLGGGGGGGALSGQTTVASSGGLATFPDLYVTRAASGYTLIASAEGLSSATSAPFEVGPSYPSALAFHAQPGASAAGEPIAPAPSVAIVDSYGNVVPNETALVAIGLASGPEGGSVFGTTQRFPEPGSGVAIFYELLVDKVGTYVLTANAYGYLWGSSVPFEVGPGAPHRIVIAVQPRDVQAGAPFSPPVEATVHDRYLNTTTVPTAVTVALASNPSGGALLGQTTVVSANGRVAFDGVAVDRPGIGYAIHLGGSGLLGQLSLGFDVHAGPVARYAIAGPSSVPAGTEVSYVATALDGAGNPVTAYVGRATVTSSDPLAELPLTSATFSGGTAAPVRVTLRTPGTQTLRLVDGADGTASGTITVNVTAPPGSPSSGGDDDGGGCGSTGGAGPGALALLALALAGRTRRRPARDAA
jgi:MYXO-CTERM domain-containing protein